MDTRFRNEIYEVLTRHESIFIQIQNTLYTISNELQSLRVFHKESSFQKNTNPQPPMLTTIHITPTNPPPPMLTTIHITSTTQTSLTGTTIPQPKFEWHIRSTKFGVPLNCGESNELELSTVAEIGLARVGCSPP